MADIGGTSCGFNGAVASSSGPSGGVAGRLYVCSNSVWTQAGASSSTPGSSTSIPVAVISAATGTQTLAFGSTGDVFYDVTLAGNTTFSLGAPISDGYARRIILMIRPAGYSAILPSSSSSLKWAGGAAPTPDTANVTSVTFLTSGSLPVLGGI